MILKRGQPTKYTEEKANAICELIATTSKSMKKICEEVGVPYSTHLQWLSDKEDYSLKYARAKEDQADFLADELLEIADESAKDAKTPQAIQRDRLRIDTRKFIASKLKPKKYGDRLDLTSDGKEIKPATIVIKPSEDGNTD